jgi:hypothetical protein
MSLAFPEFKPASDGPHTCDVIAATYVRMISRTLGLYRILLSRGRQFELPFALPLAELDPADGIYRIFESHCRLH